MDTLLALSKSTLRRVFEFLEFTELTRLYRTGDSKIAEALRNSMPYKIDLHCETRFMYGTWPTLVAQCDRLQHLELRTVSKLAELPEETAQGILALPSTLRSLILDTPEAELMLLERDEARLEALHKKYIAEALHPNPVNKPKMLNLAEMFPHLEHLEVRGGHVFASHDFCVLPPKLTSLDFGLNNLIDDEIFDYLPTSIKTLKVGAGVRLLRDPMKPTDPTFFPPNIQSFWWYRRSAPSGDSPTPSQAQLLAIPRNLQSFHYEGLVASAIPASLYGSLPPGLTDLDIAYSKMSLNVNDLDSIPPNLTCLELWNISKWKPLNSLLPQTLTELVLGTVDKLHMDTLSDLALPNGLRKLEITSLEGRLPNLAAQILPPSLTYFRHIGSKRTGTTLEGHWPEGLVELHVPGASSANGVEIELPLMLRKLSVDEMLASDLKKLPHRLESLTALNAIAPKLGKLPSQLRVLKTMNIPNLSNETISDLPRSLEHLELQVIEHPNAQLELGSCNWPNHLAHLSMESGLPEFTGVAVANLPHWLTHLENVPKISNELIGRLPRGLLYLNIRELTIENSATPINWPPHLRTLMIGAAPLVSHHLSELPRTLTTLFTPTDFKLEPADFERLPVQLRTINVDAKSANRKDFAAWTGPYDPETRELTGELPTVMVVDPTATPQKRTRHKVHARGCIIS